MCVAWPSQRLHVDYLWSKALLQAREKKKRAEYVADTDDICNKAEALRLSEQAKDRKFDMVSRLK